MTEPRKLVFDPISGEVRDKATMALVGFLDGKEPPAPSPSPEPTGEPKTSPSEPSEEPTSTEPSSESEEEGKGEPLSEAKPEEEKPRATHLREGIEGIESEVPSDKRRRNIYDPRNWVVFNDEDSIAKWDNKERSDFNESVDNEFELSCLHYDEMKNEMDADAWSRNKLKSILKDNSSKREIGNKEYGLLDLKKLHKIVTTGKVFKRKALITDKKYSVSLLVDCSGSMRKGQRNIQAAMATIKFIQEYGEYVDIEATGFHRDLIALKSFGEPISKKMLQEIFFLITSTSNCYDLVCRRLRNKNYGKLGASGNHDHLALIAGEKKLLSRDGQKFMVIFSDGAPDCDVGCGCRICHGGQLSSALKKEAERIEKTEIKLFSIGIQSGAIRNYYKNWKIVNEVAQLSKTLVELIGSQIKRMVVRG